MNIWEDITLGGCVFGNPHVQQYGRRTHDMEVIRQLWRDNLHLRESIERRFWLYDFYEPAVAFRKPRLKRLKPEYCSVPGCNGSAVAVDVKASRYSSRNRFRVCRKHLARMTPDRKKFWMRSIGQ